MEWRKAIRDKDPHAFLTPRVWWLVQSMSAYHRAIKKPVELTEIVWEVLSSHDVTVVLSLSVFLPKTSNGIIMSCQDIKWYHNVMPWYHFAMSHGVMTWLTLVRFHRKLTVKGFLGSLKTPRALWTSMPQIRNLFGKTCWLHDKRHLNFWFHVGYVDFISKVLDAVEDD